MRSFSQILADFSDSAGFRATKRAMIKEMLARLGFDTTPVVADASARAALFSELIGDEKVLNKALGAVERYDAATQTWVVQRRRSGLLGTEAPIRGVQIYPKVMSSPPTVTQGAQDAASTIASGIFTPATIDSGGGFYVPNPAAPWRIVGNAVPRLQLYPSYLFLSPENVVGNINTGNMAFEFEFDGAKFDFWLKGVGTSQRYRIIVDGELANRYGTAGPASTGSGYFILVDFGSRARRRIRLEFSASGHFGGITIGPNDTLWSMSVPRGPKVIVMGDSFSEGVIENSSPCAWWETTGKVLGWSDVQATAQGGTGYLNPGAFRKFRDRVDVDVIAFKPDILIVAGGINDTSYAPALSNNAEQIEATALFAQVRAALPAVKLIVIGPWWANGSPLPDTITIRDALRNACNADTGPHLFIDNIVATSSGANTLGWMTGTGKVGATTGSGNADLYTWTDGTHPSQVGQDYLGQRVAAGIVAGLPL